MFASSLISHEGLPPSVKHRFFVLQYLQQQINDQLAIFDLTDGGMGKADKGCRSAV